MKNYLIIGHSSGIGKSLSAQLALEHRVWGTFFRHEVPSQSDQVFSHYLNVLDDTYDLSFLPEVLHGLVYCPGTIQLKPFSKIKEEAFLEDFRLQVTGAIKVIQACLPHMKRAETASIVLFSTVAVRMGFNFHSLVSTSKGALEGLTRALAAELAPTIRVNCIAPSITQTPLARSLLNSPEKIEANAQRHPLKKIGSPEEVAQMAAYLLSDSATWVTGQIFSIDGGMSTVR